MINFIGNINFVAFQDEIPIITQAIPLRESNFIVYCS